MAKTGPWFSPGPPVSSSDKTDCHDIAEILLKVALNTIKQTNKHQRRRLYDVEQSKELIVVEFVKSYSAINKAYH